MAALISMTCRGNVHVVGLRADGVGFAKHFLRRETPAFGRNFPRRAMQSIELLEVAAQPHDLFRDVAPLGKDADFFDQIRRVECDLIFGRASFAIAR